MQLSTLALSITNVIGKQYSPASWFTQGEQGAWYDPSDITTLYQDSAGTTPVTAVEQPVGLMKDKSGNNNHAFQATAGNRPTLSARVNLLINTETLSAWIKTGGVTTAQQPDGSWQLSATASSNHQFYQSVASTVGTTTCRILVKKNTSPCFYIAGFNSKGAAYFDLTNGAVSSTVSPATNATITLDTSGFYVCSVDLAASFIEAHIGFLDAAYTGSSLFPWNIPNATATSGFVKYPDLRPTNIGAALPSYQRVTTSTDYDTVGFPLYLKTNGTSSAMATNSIDFTSTANMIVVTGYRQVDVAGHDIVELSARYDINQGSFGIFESYNGLRAGTTYFDANLTNAVPASYIRTALYDGSLATNAKNQYRLNGSLMTPSYGGSNLGTSNFGTYPLYLFARAGTSLWFNGQFYGAIICGASKTTAEIQQAESYENQKAGGLY